MAPACRPKRTVVVVEDDELDEALEPSEPPEPPVTSRRSTPRNVVVFRRADNTICHVRCGRPLSLQGVRGSLEADFYCFTCLTHVTMPLVVLDSMPVEPRIPAAEAMAAL